MQLSRITTMYLEMILRKRAENNESFCIKNFGFPEDERWKRGSQQVPNTRDSMSVSLQHEVPPVDTRNQPKRS